MYMYITRYYKILQYDTICNNCRLSLTRSKAMRLASICRSASVRFLEFFISSIGFWDVDDRAESGRPSGEPRPPLAGEPFRDPLDPDPDVFRRRGEPAAAEHSFEGDCSILSFPCTATATAATAAAAVKL
jgi:hypothetical protein